MQTSQVLAPVSRLVRGDELVRAQAAHSGTKSRLRGGSSHGERSGHVSQQWKTSLSTVFSTSSLSWLLSGSFWHTKGWFLNIHPFHQSHESTKNEIYICLLFIWFLLLFQCYFWGRGHFYFVWEKACDNQGRERMFTCHERVPWRLFLLHSCGAFVHARRTFT